VRGDPDCPSELYWITFAYVSLKIVYCATFLLLALFHSRHPSELKRSAIIADLETQRQFTGADPVNRAIFPAPSSSYKRDSFKGELFWIPKTLGLKGIEAYFRGGDETIPCLFLKPRSQVSFVMLYAHGNEEDLGGIYRNLAAMCNVLENVAICAIEYPGYGIYQGFGKSTESRVFSTLESVFFFCKKELHIPTNRIVLCGRSLGTNPITQLAVHYGGAGMILISPYTSIESVAAQFVGKKVAKKVVGKKFATVDVIESVKCPVLIIHGKQDELIPVSHAETLFEHCIQVSDDKKMLVMPADMTHNKFDLMSDIISPMHKFVKMLAASSPDEENEIPKDIQLPKYCFEPKGMIS
jgi:hypothetical protein